MSIINEALKKVQVNLENNSLKQDIPVPAVKTTALTDKSAESFPWPPSPSGHQEKNKERDHSPEIRDQPQAQDFKNPSTIRKAAIRKGIMEDSPLRPPAKSSKNIFVPILFLLLCAFSPVIILKLFHFSTTPPSAVAIFSKQPSEMDNASAPSQPKGTDVLSKVSSRMSSTSTPARTQAASLKEETLPLLPPEENLDSIIFMDPKPASEAAKQIRGSMAAEPSMEFKVNGVMLSSVKNMVLINDGIYSEGDVFDGITVLKISLNSILIQENGRERTLQVKH